MSFAHFLLYLTNVSVEANIVEPDQAANADNSSGARGHIFIHTLCM